MTSIIRLLRGAIWAAACVLLFGILACYAPKSTTSGGETPLPMSPTQRPKNIILMIGDGMGMSAIASGLYSNGNTLQLERFPITGIHKSHSHSHLVTDSAAGATAFACGCKTYNHAIGMNADTLPCPTVLEEAVKRGYATGLVATSSIVHATPASFIAHQPDRNLYEAIAADFLKTPIDCFIGGGKKYFDRRADAQDLLAAFRQKGYTVGNFIDQELVDFKPAPTKPFLYLTSDNEPLPAAQGRDYLQAAAQKVIQHLHAQAQKKGFFAMIEGSQIDWGGHANDAPYIVSEMLDFDRTIGAVLDWAAKDGNTLVIVTADHETGGFAIQEESRFDSLVTAFTTKKHTAELIPVFAYGPGAQLFSGMYENTAIYHKMRQALGWQ